MQCRYFDQMQQIFMLTRDYMPSFYAVAKGRQTGIFATWKECQKHVTRYPNAVFKKCNSIEEANAFLKIHGLTKTDMCEVNSKSHNNIPRMSVSITTPHYVYTDGACVHNGRSNASAGAGVFFGVEDSRNVSVPVERVYQQTNNVAEVYAILQACKLILKELDRHPNEKYVIVSDSNYAIQYATHWGAKQSRMGWRKDIANKPLLKELYAITSSVKQLSFMYIKAHTHLCDKHSIGNANADRLARQGIRKVNGKIDSSATKVFLQVDYDQKDVAKALGAKWDPLSKKWFTRKTHRKYNKLISIFKLST